DFTGPRDYIPTPAAIVTQMVILNLLLFLFNLIPLFPLDGWTILLKLVPPDLGYTLQRYQRESMYLFYGLILLSFVIPTLLFGILIPPMHFIWRVILPPTVPFPY